jgi:hypothetical protein
MNSAVSYGRIAITRLTAFKVAPALREILPVIEQRIIQSR